MRSLHINSSQKPERPHSSFFSITKKHQIISVLLWFLLAAHSTSADPIEDSLIKRLQFTLDSMRTSNNLKGISACVMIPGKGIWKGVSGISKNGTPIHSEMEFGIASNTKLFTGVLLLKLAENNIINLDDSLHRYLPTYKNIDSNITIRQILNHTSGIYDVTTIPGYPDSIFNNPYRIFKASELMTWAQTPLFKPGTGWSYCNTNYLLAGMIAESATGISYGKLLRDSILEPLKLDSTFLDVYDSVLYTIANPWQAGNNNINTPRKALNSAAWAAGAMYSTSGEMVQWYQALMQGKILKPNSLKEMTTFVGSGKYGIGISEVTLNGRTVWNHGGTIWGGYNSTMMYDTATGTIICVLINQLPAQAYLIASQLLVDITSYKSTISSIHSINGSIECAIDPTEEMVLIHAPSSSILRIVLHNSIGQIIGITTHTKIPLTNFTPGLNFITIQTEQGNYIKKIIRP